MPAAMLALATTALVEARASFCFGNGHWFDSPLPCPGPPSSFPPPWSLPSLDPDCPDRRHRRRRSMVAELARRSRKRYPTCRPSRPPGRERYPTRRPSRRPGREHSPTRCPRGARTMQRGAQRRSRCPCPPLGPHRSDRGRKPRGQRPGPARRGAEGARGLREQERGQREFACDPLVFEGCAHGCRASEGPSR